MKVHTTNYTDTFIEIAEDCPVEKAEVPPLKGDKKSVANLEFEIISKNPYKYTSDDVIFQVFALRNELTEEQWPEARELFFSKGQPCLRSSPLTKRYGFGIHSDAAAKVALFPLESTEYQNFIRNDNVVKVKAMRSKRA